MGAKKWTILVLLVFQTVALTLSQLATPPSNTTAVRGNQTTLMCRVMDPSAHFTWDRYTNSMGARIFSTPPPTGPQDVNHDISGTYDLVMSNLQLDDGGKYGCKTFEMADPVIISLVILDDPMVMIPDLVELLPTPVSCTASYGGPRPTELATSHRPTLRLYVDGQDQNLTPELIPGYPPQDGAPYEPSVLTMGYNYTPVLEHNGREIRCEIVTDAPKKSLSMTTIIQVRYAVRNQDIFPEKSNYKINEIINCTADGNPTPTITWMPIDTPYPHNPGKILTILSNMVGTNKWKCRATNNVQGTVYIEQEIEFIVDNEVVQDGLAPPLRHSVPVLVLAILWLYI